MRIKDIRIIREFNDLNCRLTKTVSKRTDSGVRAGESETGNVTVIQVDKLVAVEINGRGFNYIRTSAVVKVIEHNRDMVQFETRGGIYVLEKLQGVE